MQRGDEALGQVAMIDNSQQQNSTMASWKAPNFYQQGRVAQHAYDVVVVDDEAPIAQVIADLLIEEGYRVGVFHDGASALLAILEHPPRLVLLDIAMPVLTGDEVLIELRRRGYDHLPIILMSAGSRLSDFLPLGATAVIPKPFDLDQILACVSRYAGDS